MEKIRLFVSTRWPWIEDHVISALITFATGFFIVLYSQLQNLDLDKVEGATILGLLLACIRAGFKMLFQQFVLPQMKKLVEYLKNRKKTIV